MKIGVVSQALPYLPSRGGFRLYGGNLIRHLARRHEIHLVSMLIEDDADHLDWARRHCASVAIAVIMCRDLVARAVGGAWVVFHPRLCARART